MTMIVVVHVCVHVCMCVCVYVCVCVICVLYVKADVYIQLGILQYCEHYYF